MSTATNVIAAGVKAATEKGYDKPDDIATFVQVALADAGYRIVRKPRR